MTIRRILACVCLVAATGAAQSRAKKADDPDLKEIRDYRLSMDNIQRFVSAFKLVNTDAAAKKCIENNPAGDAKTLDMAEKNLLGCPAVVALLKNAGLKPREFLIITGALIGDTMAVAMKKAGQIKEYPKSISPENAAFLEQNYDKIRAMTASLGGGK